MDSLLRRVLPDGRVVELWRMLFNDRITIALAEHDGTFFEDAWCYVDRALARAVAETWDGEGDPPGWNKHPNTGRWRPDGTMESEIDQRRPENVEPGHDRRRESGKGAVEAVARDRETGARSKGTGRTRSHRMGSGATTEP
jgi:hypothetical protein